MITHWQMFCVYASVGMVSFIWFLRDEAIRQTYRDAVGQFWIRWPTCGALAGTVVTATVGVPMCIVGLIKFIRR